MPGVAPLGTGEDLLQAIEVLEAGQQGLLGQARTAGEQAHALLPVALGIGRTRRSGRIRRGEASAGGA